jgi:hypothetical protein
MIGTNPTHLKPAAAKLGLSKTIDFRSLTLNGYSESWRDERVEAVSRAVAAEPTATPPVRLSEAENHLNV